jgi:deferrochelatase/peroxidase EfeB
MMFQSLNHHSGLGKLTPGQRVVKPGVIIMGYPGDPHASTRPAFAKDGSFMVFRKLEQNVLYLQDYVEQHWNTIPGEIKGTQLSDTQRKDLFGARMVGRFKSVRKATPT